MRFGIVIVTLCLIGCATTSKDILKQDVRRDYRKVEPMTVAPVDEMAIDLGQLGLDIITDVEAQRITKTVDKVINPDRPKSAVRISYSLTTDPDAKKMIVSLDTLTIEGEQEIIKEMTTRETTKESIWSRINQPINLIIGLIILIVILAIVFRRRF